MKTLLECVRFRTELMEKFYATYPNYKDHFKVRMVEHCGIEFSYRMTTTAGYANFREQKITLNQTLLTKYPEQFNDTFAHELAHLLSYAIYGRMGAGHGHHWKHIMRVLGYKPERCHKLDTSDVKRKHAVVAVAKCNCRNHEIKARKLNMMRKGYYYRCIHCNTRLELIDASLGKLYSDGKYH